MQFESGSKPAIILSLLLLRWTLEKFRLLLQDSRFFWFFFSKCFLSRFLPPLVVRYLFILINSIYYLVGFTFTWNRMADSSNRVMDTATGLMIHSSISGMEQMRSRENSCNSHSSHLNIVNGRLRALLDPSSNSAYPGNEISQSRRPRMISNWWNKLRSAQLCVLPCEGWDRARYLDTSKYRWKKR